MVKWGLGRLLLFGAVLVSSGASAQTPNSKEYQDLCAYDNNCSDLKNKDGSYIPPKPKILLLLKELKDPIKQQAQIYGVDPRAVAGAILAENSMNVQIDDDIQDWLVKLKITPTAEVLGKPFSIGLGQIQVGTAREVEAFVAKTEGRSVRTDQEIASALETPIGSITYATAIIRKAQDDYKNQGMDISGNPGLLATLYNLGNTANKASATATKKEQPRVNYFGFFVNQNEKLIGDTLSYSPVSKKLGSTETVTAPPSATATLKADSNKNERKNLKNYLSKKVTLYSFPPQCSTNGPGEVGDYNKIVTKTNSSDTANAIGQYQVVSPGLDCDMKPWSLITTADGKTGWIDDAILKKNSEKKLIALGPTCDPSKESACLLQLKKIAGAGVLDFNKSGLLEIKLVGDKASPTKVNFKKWDSYNCLSAHTNGNTGSNNYVPPDNVPPEIATQLDITLGKKKAELVKVLELDNWDDKRNLYANLFNQMGYSLKGNCKTGCNGQLTLFNKIMAADFSQYKKLGGLRKFYADFGTNSIYFSPGMTGVQGKTVTEQWDNYFSKVDSSCKDFFVVGKKSAKAFEDLKARYKQTLASGLQMPPAPTGEYFDLPGSCKGLATILKRRESKETFKQKPATQAECEQCQIALMFTGPNGGGNPTTLSVDVADALSDSIDDFDEGLVGLIANSTNAFGPGGSYSQNSECFYDPYASAKRVEDLLKTPCVESAFVPDMFLIKKLTKYDDKIFYMPFSDNDRFAVKLRTSCSSGVKR